MSRKQKQHAPIIWHGCYDDSWHGWITAAAFAHPAKFARGLITRIYGHCLGRGYLQPGDVVGDPFGGIGTGGITAAWAGLEWIGCELEPKFVAMAEGNFLLHRENLAAMKRPLPRMVQGDSREFHRRVQGVSGVVCSPPYAESAVEKHSDGVDIEKNWETYRRSGGGLSLAGYRTMQEKHSQGYGKTSGQIAALKSGDLSAVITSPPYAESLKGHEDGIDWEKAKQNGEAGEGHSKGVSCHSTYGSSAGLSGRLKNHRLAAVVTSPPYSDIAAGAGGLNSKAPKHAGQQGGRSAESASQAADQRYGATEGQISALKGGPLNGVVMSPPYEGLSQRSGTDLHPDRIDGSGASVSVKRSFDSFTESEGQIGNDSGETYWQAMAKVYASCFMALKPGGIIAVVVKDYVKNKQRVPLCDDTARLLESLGFVVLERVHAMLVHETREGDLFAGETVRRRERKSFFRRLAEKKGSPRIDFEEVIFARRCATAGDCWEVGA